MQIASGDRLPLTSISEIRTNGDKLPPRQVSRYDNTREVEEVNKTAKSLGQLIYERNKKKGFKHD